LEALPKLADLGRISFVLHARKHQLDLAILAADKQGRDCADEKAHFLRLQTTAIALDDLGVTLPVRTLADAAAWAVFGYGELEAIATGDLAEKAGIASQLMVLLRGIAGMALVLADATGQWPEALVCADTVALMRRHAGAGVAQ